MGERSGVHCATYGIRYSIRPPTIYLWWLCRCIGNVACRVAELPKSKEAETGKS